MKDGLWQVFIRTIKFSRRKWFGEREFSLLWNLRKIGKERMRDLPWLGVRLRVQDGPVVAIDFLIPTPIPGQSEGSEVDKLPSPALGHIIVNSPR